MEEKSILTGGFGAFTRSISFKVIFGGGDSYPEIIDQHYGVRCEEDKMRQRQEVLRRSL